MVSSDDNACCSFVVVSRVVAVVDWVGFAFGMNPFVGGSSESTIF
jgi:hypothetical protein